LKYSLRLLSTIFFGSPFYGYTADINNSLLLPEAVSNNAVTQVIANNKHYLLSFSGISSNKTHADVHNKMYIFDVANNSWSQGKSVPIAQPVNGLVGRLASIATAIDDTAYIFGGYTVAEDHSEVSVPDVYAYKVTSDSYQKLAPMPVPVDDSVALSYQQRYIYLVSGWHNDGNVNLVQLYDTKTNTWQQASPFPGKAVFGHAGAIVNNSMLICDGVRIDVHKHKRRTYAAEPACYLGKINKKIPNKIDWRQLEHPTGKARYRMAAIGEENTQQLIFIGGSENPYNYNGIGYDKNPSKPSNKIWNYHLKTNQWHISEAEIATMDHRGLLLIDNKLLTIGGMGEKQQVLNTINHYHLK